MSKRKYSERNLRGCSFKEENLTGIDFQDKDIRGCDFTDANLTDAKFEKAKINGTNFSGANLTNAKLDRAVCGLKTHWTICITIISLLISLVSGFTASIILSCNIHFFRINYIDYFLTILISTIYVTFLHSFLVTNANFDVNILVSIAIVIIIVVGIFIPLIISMDEPNKSSSSHFGTIIFCSISIILATIILTLFERIPIPVLNIIIEEDFLKIFARLFGALCGAILGTWISHHAIIKKDNKFIWIWNLFIYLASIKGTRFDDSNLSDASFVEVNLRGSYFFKSTLTRTNFFQVKQIDCSRIQDGYLKDACIKHLVVKKIMKKKINCEGMILKGLNLDGADLTRINLSKADLSNSTLENAILIDSNLSQTQFDNVNLTEADITGATIEIKSIPSNATVDGLICKYFYSKPNIENRYPRTGEFTSEEEVLKLLQKPLKILLFFEEGIDWQAFLQAFENCLQQFNISTDNSETLIEAFEKKYNNAFVIRLNVPDSVKPTVFEYELKQEYKNALEKLNQEYRNVDPTNNIDFKENTDMLKMIQLFAKYRSIIIQTIFNNGDNPMSSNPGGFSVGGSVGGNVKNTQGDNNRTTQTDNSQGVLGDNNQVTQQSLVDTDAEAPLTKEDIVKLLTELENLIKRTEIPVETKEEVVEDLKSAIKATDKEEPNKNLALKRLGSVAETLEKTSKTVESGQKIWTTAKPMIVKIASWLGAAAGSYLLKL